MTAKKLVPGDTCIFIRSTLSFLISWSFSPSFWVIRNFNLQGTRWGNSNRGSPLDEEPKGYFVLCHIRPQYAPWNTRQCLSCNYRRDFIHCVLSSMVSLASVLWKWSTTKQKRVKITEIFSNSVNRTNSESFVIPVSQYMKSIENDIARGTRFRMLFENEECVEQRWDPSK